MMPAACLRRLLVAVAASYSRQRCPIAVTTRTAVTQPCRASVRTSSTHRTKEVAYA